MTGQFVPIVDLSQDDEDGNSHMSDIPLQLPATANVAPNNFALVTFSKADGDLMRNAPSLYPGHVPGRCKFLGNCSIPERTSGCSPAVLGPSGNCSTCFKTELEKL